MHALGICVELCSNLVDFPAVRALGSRLTCSGTTSDLLWDHV